MEKLIILSLVAATAFAAHIDFSNVRPRNLKPNTALDPRFPRHGRITGGKEAALNQFPYMVAMFFDYEFWCGGSIISENWVLTAAHCLDRVPSLLLVFGAHDLSSSKYKAMIVGENNFIIYPGWSAETLQDDIAVIKLPNPLTFNESIQRIFLPPGRYESASFTDKNVTAVGWGRTSDSSFAPSNVLRYVEATVLSQSLCEMDYGSTITSKHICINTFGGLSTCNGDSGGPLVYFDWNGRPEVIGTTSFGAAAGCEKGYPAVFTKISSYLLWIREKTGIPIRYI